MRRIAPLLLVALAFSACGGGALDSASAGDSTGSVAATAAPDQGGDTAAAAAIGDAPVTTTTVGTPQTTTTTNAGSAAPSTTSGATPGEDRPLVAPAHTPPAVFDSYVSTIAVTMQVDDAVLEVTGDGAWGNGSFECSLTMKLGGLALSQGVVSTPDGVWFDDGTGYRTSTLDGPAVDVLGSCPASPLFWEDFVNAGLEPTGEEVAYSGRSAIKVDLATIIDYGGSLGVVPEIEDAVINAFDMWVDAETNAVLGLYADVALDPSAIAEVPGATAGEPVAMTMDISIDRVNDPAIAVVSPVG